MKNNEIFKEILTSPNPNIPSDDLKEFRKKFRKWYCCMSITVFLLGGGVFCCCVLCAIPLAANPGY